VADAKLATRSLMSLTTTPTGDRPGFGEKSLWIKDKQSETNLVIAVILSDSHHTSQCKILCHFRRCKALQRFTDNERALPQHPFDVAP
jgi:hypothetical protein